MRMRVLRGLLDPTLTAEAVGQLTYLIQNRTSRLSQLHDTQGVADVCLFTAELFDNRDFKTLPNHQAKDEPSIWEQTQMGSKTQVSWVVPHHS